jgi:hypothetical protein
MFSPWRLIPIALLLTATPLAAQTPRPQPPEIDPARAEAITRLVRSSMLEYLNYRTEAERIPVRAALEPLSKMRYPAQVVLRDDGQVVARVLRNDGDTHRNIVAAALQAMRSEKLPDRVTAETLARLTVEVEIRGATQPVEPEDLTDRIVAGLIGAQVVHAARSARIMPSQAYLRSLSAEQTWRFCLARIPPQQDAQELQRFWSIFATRHFVHEPGRKAIYLYRGKIPGFSKPITHRQAAEQLAMSLVTAQNPAGNYRAGPEPAGLVEHLHATWVLARAGKTLRSPEARRAVEASVTLAMGLAAESIQQGPQGQVALIGLKGLEETEALGWFYLAASTLESDQQGRALLERIAEQLGRRARQDPFARTEADSESLPHLSAKLVAALCLALEAAGNEQELESLRGRLAVQPCQSPEELMWTVRAGAKPRLAHPQSARLAGADRPLDETDGLIWGPDEPTTQASSLAAANLLAGRRWPGVPMAQDRRRHAADRLLRFCRRMIIRRPEAYFAADPALWTGAVRIRPGGAAVSLTSASCALEALLAAE